MQEKNITPLEEKFMLFKISKNQEKFINDSTYCIMTPGGKNFERTFELLAYNTLSGKILLKEKVSFDCCKYEKMYVLSSEGETEKFKGEGF
ncbi:MAG TPA: hypothetical protein P5556_03780 [Candidatus Gastranaerophilales bacterium]|nr:hypothetical protein [Candidatus Gastranaerophilales bacterium]